jgi:hypothetical protein
LILGVSINTSQACVGITSSGAHRLSDMHESISITMKVGVQPIYHNFVDLNADSFAKVSPEATYDCSNRKLLFQFRPPADYLSRLRLLLVNLSSQEREGPNNQSRSLLGHNVMCLIFSSRNGDVIVKATYKQKDSRNIQQWVFASSHPPNYQFTSKLLE